MRPGLAEGMCKSQTVFDQMEMVVPMSCPWSMSVKTFLKVECLVRKPLLGPHLRRKGPGSLGLQPQKRLPRKSGLPRQHCSRLSASGVGRIGLEVQVVEATVSLPRRRGSLCQQVAPVMTRLYFLLLCHQLWQKMLSGHMRRRCSLRSQVHSLP